MLASLQLRALLALTWALCPGGGRLLWVGQEALLGTEPWLLQGFGMELLGLGQQTGRRHLADVSVAALV